MIGSGLDLAATVSGTLSPGAAALITDSRVSSLHSASAVAALEEAGWWVTGVFEFPAGETSKSLDSYGDLVRRLARSGLGRDGTVFALGGGVVGDLGGFVAATYARGVDLVMLPTTLLAMVDSSVGGKVGVDLPEGKNLVGAFARPRLVAANLDWLSTLPERELRNGLAEVIKMGLLAGGRFFDDLSLIPRAAAGDPAALETLVLHSVRFKAGVVAEDEREGGRRAILNYGHTIGHGLEAAAGYAMPHGEAVSLGMAAEARLSRERLGADLVSLHEDLLGSAGLPIRAPALNPDAVLTAMGRDKKRRAADAADTYRFVLLEGVGAPRWDIPVQAEEARRAMEAIVA
ncbi:MAG: 3-dehydroquinate synthase [Actinomycetota bacterium]